MKRFSPFLVPVFLMSFLVGPFNLSAQDVAEPVPQGPGFVDTDGEGYTDHAPDADGDGVPNGQDPDSGSKGSGRKSGTGFVDEDGDGVNDNVLKGKQRAGNRGETAQGERPQDGTGKKHGGGGHRTGQGQGSSGRGKM